MRLSNAYRILSAVTFGVPLLLGTAYAGDQYQCSIIEAPAAGGDLSPVNTSDFHLLKSGKLVIKPAPKSAPGTAVATQIILTKVDCVDEGNDGAKPGKCGVKGAPVHAVLDMSVHQFLTPGVTGPDLMHVAGIPLLIEKGTATFAATHKNKIAGPDAFGSLISGILGQPMGYHVTVVRTEGSVPSDCDNAPAGPGCLDGVEFGFTGFVNGN